jgi:hypothetical protein
MGAFLQIRVSAVTFDPGKVDKAWPGLVKLAFPTEATPPRERAGVLELVAALSDRLALGEVAESDGFDPRPGIRAASALAARLEEALAARDPQTADMLSYRIEDTLAELERGLG